MGRMKIESTTPKQPRPYGFQPGVSGNPAGRPMGSRNKLTENILADLATFYEREGMALIEKVRDENPGLLLQSLIKLVPREAHLNISGSAAVLNLTIDQRERIAESWLVSQADEDAIKGVAVRIEPDKKKALNHDSTNDQPARVKRAKTTDRVSRDTD